MSYAEDFYYDPPDFIDYDIDYDQYEIVLIHQTKKAYLFDFGKFESWVPKSLCTNLTRDSVEIRDNFKFTKVRQANIHDMFEEVIEKI